ncbi:Ig-like domain-containing protein [Gammaproteobacteria bacterium]|nr:Ig-like domain-containing protein [Gammaproteobacteria bacterium]MDA9041204.1 Ig-like domain-containing protein [Gammaproteobacteria bacterium]
MKFLYFPLVFLIASCGGGGGGGSDTPGPQIPSTPLPTVNLSADPLSVLLDSTSTLSWSSTNANACSASWTSQTTTSGSETVTVSTAGDNNYSISCTGAGGSGSDSVTVKAFALTLASGVFSTDEDTELSGSIAASANEDVTITYSITSEASSGNLTLNSDGSFLYRPNNNYFGTDHFEYTVNVAEKNLTETGNANITINSVDDMPTISFEANSDFSKNTMLFEDIQTFRVIVSDIDTDIADLTFDTLIGDQLINSSFTLDAGENTNGSGTFEVNLSALQKAGLYSAQLSVNDSTSSAALSFESWFVSNKTTVTIQQDDDPEDGFGSDGGTKTPKDYIVYYLSGNPSSLGKTKYLFIADSLDGISDIDLYRRALIASINKLNDSDASDFFSEDYFTIISAEPIDPDGSSPVGVRTGCYDFDEDVYCIGDMDTGIFEDLLSDYVLVSTLTRVQGRGVNSGNRNIQKIRDTDPERTSTTLMHELGHAHGYMGDEYRSDDDRDVSQYADENVNTSTQSDVSILKWNHHITDQLNVLGRDIEVCYNLGDGQIYDRDSDEYVSGTNCGCLLNIWGSLTDDPDGGDPYYPFIGKNPDCSGVGLFEGNYYGEFDNYRPTFCSIMDSCSSGGYGDVNVEGFAVGSIQNQGFYSAFDDVDFGFAEGNSAWQMTVNAEYDTSKITLKWYVNGVEQVALQNQKTVSFNRTAGVDIYTAKAVDLTGTVIATDDVIDNTDFYKGIFQSYFVWCADYSDGECNDFRTEPDPNEYSGFDYGYMNGPLGFTWGINWAKW